MGSPGGERALDAIEERLEAIERLIRKHGGSVRAVAEHAQRARARREELLGAEVELTDASERLQRARAGPEGQVRALRAAPPPATPPRACREPCASSSSRWRWAMPPSRSCWASATPARAGATP